MPHIVPSDLLPFLWECSTPPPVAANQPGSSFVPRFVPMLRSKFGRYLFDSSLEHMVCTDIPENVINYINAIRIKMGKVDARRFSIRCGKLFQDNNYLFCKVSYIPGQKKTAFRGMKLQSKDFFVDEMIQPTAPERQLPQQKVDALSITAHVADADMEDLLRDIDELLVQIIICALSHLPTLVQIELQRTNELDLDARAIKDMFALLPVNSLRDVLVEYENVIGQWILWYVLGSKVSYDSFKMLYVPSVHNWFFDCVVSALSISPTISCSGQTDLLEVLKGRPLISEFDSTFPPSRTISKLLYVPITPR